MITIRKMKIALHLASACCFGFAALPATAGPLLPGQSDSLTVYDPSGAVVAQTIATEADEVANGNGFIYIIPLGGLVSTAMFGNPTTVYEDAANPNDLSDIFGIASGVPGCLDGRGLCLAFSSDIDGIPFAFGPFPDNRFEASGVFDATRFLEERLIAQGFTAEFRSDVVTVPEPASASLIALGLMALAAWRKKLLF
jgi:hypothetical protein